MKKIITFKNIYRSVWVSYWLLVYFVHPSFLIALVLYGCFRIYVGIDDDFNYSHWKRVGYGKSDTKLTYRKLLYIIDKCEKLKMHSPYIYRNIDDTVTEGIIYLDQNLKLELNYDPYDTFKYTIELYFNTQEVSVSKGYSWMKTKWQLDDMPELKKALFKYLENIESEFERSENNLKKQNEKTKKNQDEQKKRQRKQLAKEARETYKKDMTI